MLKVKLRSRAQERLLEMRWAGQRACGKGVKKATRVESEAAGGHSFQHEGAENSSGVLGSRRKQDELPR